jgi:hypothetical protein
MTDRLIELTDGVWIDTGPVRIVGMPLGTTMTVLCARDGLLVHSPLPLTASRRAAVEELGRVAHLYAPNTFHHLWIGEWAAAFPSAKLHAPEGLVAKRPDLRVDRVVGSAPEPAFAELIDEVRIEGFRLEEHALVHRPTRTALVADLVHNIGRPDHAWTRLYAGAMGFYGRVALSRVIRWTAFSDRAAARASVDALLAHDFDRLVVGHGAPLDRGAHDALAAAYAWLRSPGLVRAARRDRPWSVRGAPCG